MTAQSATPTLTAKSRTETGRRAKALRVSGVRKEFTDLFNEVGSSTLVALKVDDKAAVKVLIHDVQISALRHEATHADFYIVNLKEKLRTEVPLVFEGVADAVDVLGGTLITVRDFVEIECLPDDLLSEIIVDLSKLKTFEDTLTIADLVVPSTVTIMDEMDQTLASVTEPRSEEEMAALDEAVDTEVKTEFATEDGKTEGGDDVDSENKKD
jgi:large subunit ribosomal protein L25